MVVVVAVAVAVAVAAALAAADVYDVDDDSNFSQFQRFFGLYISVCVCCVVVVGVCLWYGVMCSGCSVWWYGCAVVCEIGSVVCSRVCATVSLCSIT